jgi:hypothetical protein
VCATTRQLPFSTKPQSYSCAAACELLSAFVSVTTADKSHPYPGRVAYLAECIAGPTPSSHIVPHTRPWLPIHDLDVGDILLKPADGQGVDGFSQESVWLSATATGSAAGQPDQ